MNDKKVLYNTVLSQVISNCGEYLFVGNNFGEIFVYSIPQILEGPSRNITDNSASTAITGDTPRKCPSVKPLQIYLATEKASPIYSLAFYKDDFLIIGTTSIIGCQWYKKSLTKKLWEIQLLPIAYDIMQNTAEVNCLWLNDKPSTISNQLNARLYAGCGNNLIYEINLEDGKIIRTFEGHKDYIHAIQGGGGSGGGAAGANGGDGNSHQDPRLYSASEDGTIRFWDTRDKQMTGILTPFENEKLNRPKYGKWQGTVAVTDDWLICGGGPKLSLWHLRSLECTTVFEFPEKLHVCGFLDDIIYGGGDHNELFQFSFNGDIVAQVPGVSPSIYSVAWQNEPFKIMSIGGSNNYLDIFTDFKYSDIILNLYENNRKFK